MFDNQFQELERQVVALDADNKALRQKVTTLLQLTSPCAQYILP
jgi:hypothetical protein